MSQRPSAGGFAAAAIAPVVFLAADPAGWSPFTPVKWWTISTLVPLAATLALARRPSKVHRPSAIAWAGLLAWVALAAGLGNDRLYAWLGTPERHFGALTWLLCALAFLAGQQLRRAADVTVVLAGLVVAGWGVGGYALIELLWRAPIALDAATSRLGGPFGSAAYLGAACALLLPAQIGVAFERELTRGLRAGATIGAALTAIALVGSGTRGAWLAVAITGVVVAVRRGGWRRASVAAAAMVVLAGLLALAPGVRSAAQRRGGAEGAARIDEWRVALRVAQRNLLTGTGPEGYRIAFPGAVDAAYERAHGRAETPDRAHDVALDVTATLGLPGLALYGVLAALVGALVWRGLRRAPPWRAGLCAGLVAYGLQQVVLFPLAELEPVAWMLAGVVVAWQAAGRGDATAVARNHARSSDAVAAVVVRRPWRIVLGVLALVACLAGLLDVLADRRARVALRTGRDGASAAALRPDALRYRLVAARTAPTQQDALGALDAGRSLSPDDPVLRLERARVVGTLAAWRDVTDHDPVNAVAWLRRGVAAANEGDTADAERSWTVAEDLAPRSAVPAVNLSRLYLSVGRVADARAAAQRALARDPHDADAIEAAAAVDRVGS